MDWWHERYDRFIEGTGAKGLEDYDPLGYVTERSSRVADLYGIGCRLATTDHPDIGQGSEMGKHFRNGYRLLLNMYASHDAKYERGWGLVPATPGYGSDADATKEDFKFSLEAFVASDVAQARSALVAHMDLADGLVTGGTRSARKTANRTIMLVGAEVQYLHIVLNHFSRPTRSRKRGWEGES